MDDQKFYQYINTAPMPLWLAMMFAPNSWLARKGSRSGWVFMLLGFNYFWGLIRAIRSDEGESGVIDFSKAEGIQQAIGTRSGALAAWAHMLPLDLFAGAWIFRDAQRNGVSNAVRIVALTFTLMTGPFGLLLYLAWRKISGTGDVWLEEENG